MIIPQHILTLMHTLENAGYEAYIIGGAVRDYTLGITPKDYDLFTNATGEQILSLFPNGKVIGGEDRQAKILTVIVDGVEISQYRQSGDRTEVGECLIKHISTCDFTFNAMACNSQGEILDVVDGTTHLENGELCFVGNAEARVLEDPLRLFRGIRFMAKYYFNTTEDIFYRFKDYVQELPVERVRDEFLKIIVLTNGFATLEQFHMMDWLLPEFNSVRHLEGGVHHAETVGDHLVEARRIANTLSDNPLFVLATFLHDIGKGDCHEFKPTGITFHGHEHSSKAIVSKFMERFKFGTKETLYVTTLIESHMFSYKNANQPLRNKTYANFFNQLEAGGVPLEDFIALSYCDKQANVAKPRVKFLDFLTDHELWLKRAELKNADVPFKITDLKINGLDVIARGLNGVAVGDALRSVHSKVLDGELPNSRPELLFFLKTNYGV